MCIGKVEVHKEDNRKGEEEEMWAASVCFLHRQVICRLWAYMHVSSYAFYKKRHKLTLNTGIYFIRKYTIGKEIWMLDLWGKN